MYDNDWFIARHNQMKRQQAYSQFQTDMRTQQFNNDLYDLEMAKIESLQQDALKTALEVSPQRYQQMIEVRMNADKAQHDAYMQTMNRDYRTHEGEIMDDTISGQKRIGGSIENSYDPIDADFW